MTRRTILPLLLATAWFLATGVSTAHHFKGLPHYNYFENYPQVPEEEFIGEVGDYEVSLWCRSESGQVVGPPVPVPGESAFVGGMSMEVQVV